MWLGQVVEEPTEGATPDRRLRPRHPEAHVADPVSTNARSDFSAIRLDAVINQGVSGGAQALADENLRLKKRLAFEEQQNAKLRQEL